MASTMATVMGRTIDPLPAAIPAWIVCDMLSGASEAVSTEDVPAAIDDRISELLHPGVSIGVVSKEEERAFLAAQSREDTAMTD
jgi:hypothetical protein